MENWNKRARPPKEALRQIQGGRLKGKTDINPQWRYKAMTEVFGACGEGWKYTVDKLMSQEGAGGELFAFASISLCVKVNNEWGEPIPGHGGSMLVTKESSGLHSSDEGYKMAITDALSVAMKMLGVGADIYAGLWDGTKYTDTNDPQQEKQPIAPPSHYCQVHKINFFMKGKMKSHAHPIDGSDDADGKKVWCYEHKAPESHEKAPEKEKTKDSTSKPKPQPESKTDGEPAQPEDNPTATLLRVVMENMSFPKEINARNWLKDVCKIDPARIDNDAEAVLKEVKELQGWS